ncbi:MAG: hypothetical protein LBR87_02965 [Synergistaceae bacterium]|jgi:predicted nicotinamide N-methyase|nr:hypothetical protein [Synergistaceae bacterium]
MEGAAAVTKAGTAVTASLRELRESFYQSTKTYILTEEKSRERIERLYLVGRMLDDVGEMRRRIVLAVDAARGSKAAQAALEQAKAIRERAAAVRSNSTGDPNRRELLENVLEAIGNYKTDLEILVKAFDETTVLNESRAPVLAAYEEAIIKAERSHRGGPRRRGGAGLCGRRGRSAEIG